MAVAQKKRYCFFNLDKLRSSYSGVELRSEADAFILLDYYKKKDVAHEEI